MSARLGGVRAPEKLDRQTLGTNVAPVRCGTVVVAVLDLVAIPLPPKLGRVASERGRHCGQGRRRKIRRPEKFIRFSIRYHDTCLAVMWRNCFRGRDLYFTALLEKVRMPCQ